MRKEIFSRISAYAVPLICHLTPMLRLIFCDVGKMAFGCDVDDVVAEKTYG
jgi:hypothetical protein